MDWTTFDTEPSEPRTTLREQSAGEAPEVRPMTAVEEAMLKALVDYPEAYEAVLSEVRRICGVTDGSP